MLSYLNQKNNMKSLKLFKEFAGPLQVRFSNHAITRLKEAQLDLYTAKKLLYESVKSPERIDTTKKKFTRNQDNISYWINGTIIFTLVKKEDEYSQHRQDMFLVLTVTERRATVKYISF